MKIRNLFEAKARRIVAIMPGGFHPFHPGHKSLYDWAVKTFGQSNVYVAATNDTATRPFPFEVKKKLAAMAGVPESNFIQVKSPFNLNSYKDMLGDDAAIVFVRSQKDKSEQPLPDQTKKNGEPGYLRTYTGKDLNTSNEMGYMAYGPTINFDFSGMQIKSASELRATWPEMSDEDKLKAAKLMYGNGAETAVQLLNKALGDPEAPVGEILGFATRTPKRTSIKKKPEKFDEPTVADKIAARRKAAAKGDKDAWKSKKALEKAPPGREKQVKKLKGKFDDPGAPYAIAWAQHNKHGKPKKKTNEGYKLQLERDTDMMVLNIVDTATGKRTEVRGKPGYETGNYDPNDKLHMLLDKIGKAADISQLMNGEPVGINPKHPQGASAKAATDKAYSENFADGKKKGKSRPGRVKRSGASCNGSVTALRKRAKNASGEKAKMYHWCANMKSGRKKK
jgi:hypothetical protein